MRYLGIDYGKRKIGLAISEGQLAEIYGVIEIAGLEDALSKVKEIIKKESINRVVLGVAESGEAKRITTKFSRELNKAREIEVIEVEETLSSYEARALMRDLHIKDKSKEDGYAAVAILQHFLNSLD